MTRTDSASRVLVAPLDRVYAALITESALLAWLPPNDMTGRFERFDLRPGGGYRLVLGYPEGSGEAGKAGDGTDVVEARILEVVGGERVVQAVDFESDDPAFAGTMRMTWAVSPVDGGTRVDFTAADVPDGISAEDHAEGLASSLDNLVRYVEG